MKAGVLIWSLTLAAAPLSAQEHKPAAQTVAAAKPAETKTAADNWDKAKPEKPAAAPAKATTPVTAMTAQSAADRIMKRLDQEFPKKPATPATAAHSNATPANVNGSAAAHSTQRLTLSWRIALTWPTEITGDTIK